MKNLNGRESMEDITKQKQDTKAKLIMAATHIGCILDIPPRSLDALRQADLLIFEEDRPARAALKAAGIHREYMKLSEHVEKDTLEQTRSAFKRGLSVCYMSDQGMPVIADPGQKLLKMAYEMNVQVTVIPGASSITATLAACPFLNNSFRYLGFLPKDKIQREKAITSLKGAPEPIVIMETPYRRKHLLQSLVSILGGKRQAFIGYDISGPNESFQLGGLEKLDQNSPEAKLNFVIVIDRA